MTARIATWGTLMALLITAETTLTHNANLHAVHVGQTRQQVLDTAGPPVRVERPLAEHDECLAYRWIGPVALASGCERWVFLRGGRVVKVYDAKSP